MRSDVWAGLFGGVFASVVTVGGVVTVTGTVTSTPSGTTTVSGTVTASPTGTTTVSGTVTATPTGTTTVSGTITAVASGTTTVAGAVDAEITGPLAAFGELLTANVHPEAAWRFDYGVISEVVSATVASTGTINVVASRAQLSTGVGAAGLARVQSVRPLRYLPGVGGLVRMTAVFATGTASSQQLAGVGDLNDGFFFGYDGTSFGVMRRRAGSDVWVPQASWNGTALGETLVPQYGNIYQIRYQWLGYGLIKWYIFDKSVRDFVLVHTLLYPNTSALTHILNPTLPLFAEIQNTGNTTDLSLFTPSALGANEGEVHQPHHPLDVFDSFDASATYTDTNTNHLLSIQNKSLAFAGDQTNRVPVVISSFTVSRSASGASTSTIYVYRNATTVGARSYTDVSAEQSPVSTSTTTTTVSSTNPLRRYSVSTAVTTFTVELDHQITLNPGDVLTFAIKDSGVQSTDVVVTVNWTLEF